MTVDATLNNLRELASAFEGGCRPTFHPPAPSASIAEFERVAGFPLPEDLYAFLSQTGAVVAMSIHNGYWLGGIDQLTRAAQAGELPKSAAGQTAIPIATDGGGNAFLISADGRVWRWNHETGEASQVSASFVEFLNRVAADWQAYASGASGWQFLV